MEETKLQHTKTLEIYALHNSFLTFVLRKTPLSPETLDALTDSDATTSPQGTTSYFRPDSLPEAKETLLIADNFDPFAASLLYFEQSMQWIQAILTTSEHHVVLKTSSPLVLLASPLLQNPRVHVLFVLHSPGSQSIARLAERVATLETLHDLGVHTQILWTERPEEQTAASKNAKRQLCAIGTDFILTPERRHTSLETQILLQQWWEDIQLQDAVLDTRCAA